ncbi:MAG: CDP-diacylglycerol--glycerol-3-phosphate 3-phosphatidyltransferase [Candidatus Omnitrophica bacterium]|nr:CDP-diacylglycerol--glycerol-3-phosphate 3-phosphatidyltransferase [Candidatus Omnitrophota bacterium]
MTLPTKLTLARILLTFLIMALIFAPGVAAKSVALACFLLASLTDWLDGWLARRRRQTSPLGALLDPIADKILVLGLLLSFVQLGLVQAWMVLLIALREFVITGLRLVAANRQIVLPAEKAGKHKTVSQMVAIGIVLLALILQERSAAQVWRRELIHASMWVALILTVISGASFCWRHRAVLRETIGH